MPLFGGGTDNIAFLLGQPATPPPSPNADAVQMTAVFWIEGVEEVLHIPYYRAGSPPLFLKAKASIPGQPFRDNVDGFRHQLPRCRDSRYGDSS
ncbi:MAG: hypothetical protein WA804_07710 [Terriglobales bacterium]